MAEPGSRERLQPSLLDRLTDHAPDSRRESADQQTLTMQQLRQAVLRDLAWLLNTSDLETSEDMTATPLAAKSTINFGVPGFTGMVRVGGRGGGLEAMIAESIRSFEPRIRPDSIRVRLRPMAEDNPLPALVFEIEGELWAQPVPQQLFLETSIELETRLVVVNDARQR
jgi:type VI secretion system protein ImpF